MFSSPSKRGSSTSTKIPLNGLFYDGIWKCNCNPRIPAAHFQVKKEGPNTGRWFYTCQEPKESGCGFFIWDDAAKSREGQGVINTTRSEDHDEGSTPSDGTRDKTTIEGHSAASNRWIADLGKVAEDEVEGWPLSPMEESNLAQDWRSAPTTPRKTIKSDHSATPGSKRKWPEDSLPTPATLSTITPTLRKDEDIFFTPGFKLKGGMWDGNEHILNPSITPTPSRYRESVVMSEALQDNGQKSYDISEDVIKLLKDQNIDEETTTNLKQLLNRHALKTSGIAKGRDITRLALKAKDAKIAELQQRISALETERLMDRTIIQQFKKDIAHSIEKRRGRGRGKT